MTRFAIAATLAAVVAAPAAANDYEPALESFLEAEIMTWSSDPVLVRAIRGQNHRTGGLTQDAIDAMDQAWRAEVGAASRPTIDPVLTNAASDFLRERVAASGGAITEIFVMDARGLNVAASGVTSDYWQGDEAKFSETYPLGSGAVHFGDVEFDESSQTFQSQISISITDPETNETVGAMTVGVDAEALL